MREYIGPDRLATKAQMLRTEFRRRNRSSGTCLLVEGQTDSVVFYPWIVHDTCYLVPTDGKRNALDTLHKLETSNFTGVLAIIDADYDRHNGVTYASPNIVVTDTNDMETMLATSPALKKLLTQLLPVDKLSYLEGFAKDVIDKAIELAASIGKVRLHSMLCNLSLTFERIRYEALIDVRALRVDEDRLVSEIHKRSNTPVSLSNLKTDLRGFSGHGTQLIELCRGHDVTEILVIVIKTKLQQYVQSTDAEQRVRGIAESRLVLERNLRMCYEYEHFRSTKMYRMIRDWEASNPQFSVLQQVP